MAISLTIAVVSFSANPMPVFDFTYQGVRYYGCPGWEVINLWLTADRHIMPGARAESTPLPHSESLSLGTGALPGTKTVRVGLKGTQAGPILEQVREDASTNPAAIWRIRGGLKQILAPYFNLT